MERVSTGSSNFEGLIVIVLWSLDVQFCLLSKRQRSLNQVVVKQMIRQQPRPKVSDHSVSHWEGCADT